EADDVRATVAGDVREKARVLVDAPAAGFEAKVRDHELRRLKGAVAVAEGDVDSRVSKTDDIGPSIATEVGEKAGALVDAPAAGFLTKVGKHETNGSKRTAAIA